jgi:hypothetical protein
VAVPVEEEAPFDLASVDLSHIASSSVQDAIDAVAEAKVTQKYKSVVEKVNASRAMTDIASQLPCGQQLSARSVNGMRNAGQEVVHTNAADYKTAVVNLATSLLMRDPRGAVAEIRRIMEGTEMKLNGVFDQVKAHLELSWLILSLVYIDKSITKAYASAKKSYKLEEQNGFDPVDPSAIEKVANAINKQISSPTDQARTATRHAVDLVYREIRKSAQSELSKRRQVVHTHLDSASGSVYAHVADLLDVVGMTYYSGDPSSERDRLVSQISASAGEMSRQSTYYDEISSAGWASSAVTREFAYRYGSVTEDGAGGQKINVPFSAAVQLLIDASAQLKEPPIRLPLLFVVAGLSDEFVTKLGKDLEKNGLGVAVDSCLSVGACAILLAHCLQNPANEPFEWVKSVFPRRAADFSRAALMSDVTGQNGHHSQKSIAKFLSDTDAAKQSANGLKTLNMLLRVSAQDFYDAVSYTLHGQQRVALFDTRAQRDASESDDSFRQRILMAKIRCCCLVFFRTSAICVVAATALRASRHLRGLVEYGPRAVPGTSNFIRVAAASIFASGSKYDVNIGALRNNAGFPTFNLPFYAIGVAEAVKIVTDMTGAGVWGEALRRQGGDVERAATSVYRSACLHLVFGIERKEHFARYAERFLSDTFVGLGRSVQERVEMIKKGFAAGVAGSYSRRAISDAGVSPLSYTISVNEADGQVRVDAATYNAQRILVPR